MTLTGATLTQTQQTSGSKMAIKAILVHLNDRRRAARLIAVAKALAKPAGAHILGLHVYSGLPPLAPVTIPYSDEVLSAVREAEQSETSEIEAVFGQATEGLEGGATWLSAVAPGPDIAGFVMQHARATDLIVAAQADPSWDMAPVYDFPERLAIEGGRPLLMVPNAGSFEASPRHAVIAWNGSREIARAAFDANALLEPDCLFSVIVIANETARSHDMEGSADALVATLKRHGRSAKVHRVPAGGRNIGDALIAETRNLGGDLLVMGAYGHSRFRELVFGGATRHVTHHLEILTLLAH